MRKRIAVIVGPRQGEGLRMALGLTLSNDQVDVYLRGPLREPSEQTRMSIEMLREVGAGLYVVEGSEEGFSPVEPKELAQRLLGYDLVVPY
mgnify:CR=1 FL=1|jgi:hypothetical protein